MTRGVVKLKVQRMRTRGGISSMSSRRRARQASPRQTRELYGDRLKLQRMRTGERGNFFHVIEAARKAGISQADQRAILG